MSLCEPLWNITERDLLSYPKGNIKEDLDLITYMVDNALSEAKEVTKDKAVQARLEQARKNDDSEVINDWASIIQFNLSAASEMGNMLLHDILYEHDKLVNLINQYISTDKYYRNWFILTIDHIIKLHRSLTALRDSKDGGNVLTIINTAIGLSSLIKAYIKEILMRVIITIIKAFNL